MQEFLKWTLETIRKDAFLMSWMEEKRLEWVPLAASMLEKLLRGRVFIIMTDDEREWFSSYAVHFINRSSKNRPLLPFIPLKTVLPNVDELKTKKDLELLDDMLSLTFPNGYTFFYIGKSNNIKSQIAKSQDDSFLWMIDEEMQNSFYLRSNDESLDVKLIQLFRLLDKSIDALLFAEVSLDN